MEKQFGFKELYDVFIKTTYPIEINGKNYERGETVATFDKIQLANFEELKKFVNAHGGFDDRARVWWESTKEIQLYFEQGIFSETQFAILNNIKAIKPVSSSALYLYFREKKESDENGIVNFTHAPCDPTFIYDYETGEKISEFSVIDEKTIKINRPFKEVLLDYCWEYQNPYSKFIFGRQLTNGTFVFTAKTKVVDDITGQVRTGILTIPKLKLMSDLSMTLGQKAHPVVGSLSAIACPTGDRGNEQTMIIDFLNDDIDSEM